MGLSELFVETYIAAQLVPLPNPDSFSSSLSVDTKGISSENFCRLIFLLKSLSKKTQPVTPLLSILLFVAPSFC